jgi:hypothetical protein
MNETKWAMVFGFALLAAITGIALTIAIGHVEERSSYGLLGILGSFQTLAGAFAGWAFGKSRVKNGGSK